MKTRSKLLIASLFAGLSLGVLSGVKFAFSDNKPLEANAANTTRAGVSANWQAWSSTTAPTTAGYYYLTKDIDVATSWGLNNNFSIDFNGHWLSYNGSSKVATLVINGGTINLYNSTGTGGVRYGNLGSISMKGGTCNMYSGTVKDTRAKGGVHLDVNNPTFNLRGGSVSGNKSGGVRVDSGIFNMYSGTLSNNGADDSAENVTVCSGCTFNMYGGSMTGNHTSKPQIACASGTLKIDGGYIGSCTSGKGIYTYKANVTYTSGRFYNSNSYTPLLAGKTSSVTFNRDGGTGGPANNTYTWNVKPGNITIPSKTGYTFGGYYDTHDEQYFNASGTAQKVWDYVGAQTLKAKWTAKTYTVSLDKQSGTGGTTSVTGTYGSAMPKVTIPARTGYTFGGYYTSTGGSGTQYYKADGTSAKNWDKTSATTLYAKWTPNTYSVKYDGNGATAGSMSNSTHTYGVAKNLTTNAFTKTGYTFEGWATSVDGDVVYSNEQSVSNLTSENGVVVTLYAKWSANTVYVDYFDKGGVEFSGEHGSDVKYFFDYDKGLTLDTPTKQYFTFEGYYLNSDCSGSAITCLEAFSYANDVKLYAKWVKTLSNFAREFLDLTGSYCSGDKSFTNTLKDSFNMLSASDKELFIDTEVVEGLGNTYSSDIVEAKSRYYNMVTERGFDQFLEGMNVQPMSKSLFNTTTFFGIEEEDIPEVSTAAVLVVLGGFSVGAYFLLKKKKFN